MKFVLKMSAKSLFKDSKSFQERQQRLFDYGKWLSNKLKRPLVKNDFRLPGRITRSVIVTYFKSIKNYLDSFGTIDFKLLLSMIELFRGYASQQEKCQRLIDYGNWLSRELKRPLVKSDFEVAGRVSFTIIAKYFDGSMINYVNSCEFQPTRRKKNMNDAEMREFLKDKKTITEKGCWITDYWKTSNRKGRIQIQYKGKFQFLYRVSYILFKGSIPEGMEATHSCHTPCCYNPDHIFPDTHGGNMRQATERGSMRGSIGKKRGYHGITDPGDYEALLTFVKQHVKINKKEEWIFPTPPSQVYPTITINYKRYRLHRLLLASKLGKKYDAIDVACHVLPDGSKPDKRDVNPDHLFESTGSGNALSAAAYHKGYKLNMGKANQVRDAAAKVDFSKRGSKRRFDRKWAAKLNVSKECIADIRVGRNWKLVNCANYLQQDLKSNKVRND